MLVIFIFWMNILLNKFLIKNQNKIANNEKKYLSNKFKNIAKG